MSSVYGDPNITTSGSNTLSQYLAIFALIFSLKHLQQQKKEFSEKVTAEENAEVYLRRYAGGKISIRAVAARKKEERKDSTEAVARAHSVNLHFN